MFAFDLNKTEVWVAMTLLILCFSICPHWCCPHVQEYGHRPGVVENLDNEDDYELVKDNDEEQEDLMKETDVENAPTKTPDCVPNFNECDKDKPKKCCGGSSFTCEGPYNEKKYWCVDLPEMKKDA